MKTKIVRVGNSRGIRIPKALLEESGFDGEVDITLRDDCLVISKPRKPREGWADAFGEMTRRGDDRLPDDGASTSEWDEEEWEWP